MSVARLLSWGADLAGPAHSAALLRIALALLVWARFSDEVAPWQAVDPLFLSYSIWMFFWPALAVIGLHSRLAIAMTGLGVFFGYFMLGAGLRLPYWFHHHVYILGAACLMVALTPCGRVLSVDRLRGNGSEEGPLWGLRIIGLQLSAVYFWTAVNKTDWAWVNGERLEQTLTWIYGGRVLEAVLLVPGLAAASATLVLVVEYFLAFAIHIRRWQPWVLPIGLSLHAAFYLLLPVNTYSITMMVLYLALVPPEAVRDLLARLMGR